MSTPTRKGREVPRCAVADADATTTRCGQNAGAVDACWTTARSEVTCVACIRALHDEDIASSLAVGSTAPEDGAADADRSRVEALWQLHVMPANWTSGRFNLDGYDCGIVRVLTPMTDASFTRWNIAMSSSAFANSSRASVFAVDVDDGSLRPIEVARIAGARLMQLDSYGMLLEGYDRDYRRTVWRLEPRGEASG